MDPSHIFGIIFSFLAGAISFIVAYIFYRRYIENKSKRTLYIFLDFFCVGISSPSLALEKIFLIFFPDGILGIISGYIALFLSGFAIFFQGMYVSEVVFPKYIKKIAIFFSSLFSIYFILALIRPPSLIPSLYEIEFPFYLNIATLFTGALILLINSTFLFYYSYKMKKRSPPHSTRSAWLAIANFIVLIAYVPEITLPSLMSNYFRFIFILNPLAWYVAVIKFAELEWPKKIRQLYVIHAESGLCIYEHGFREDVLEESNLITSSISGISKIIPEITKSKNALNYLDQGDVKILLEHGPHVIISLITEANFGILRNKLKEFLLKFETHFKEKLPNFSGELNQFTETEKLIEEVFSYNLLDETLS